MAAEDEGNVEKLDITAVSTLNSLFQRLQDADVFNIVDSVTFDTNSQTVIFQLLKASNYSRLLRERADQVDRHHSAEEESADAKIKNLSETFKSKYPELLNHFKEWKPLRQTLLEMLRNSSNNLERNSSIVSRFRIFTSAADILGTMIRYHGLTEFPAINILMENASMGGLLALFIEAVMSKKIHADVKEAIKKDQESFEKIVQWFKQTNELDETVRGFFPYGIDKEVLKKIHTCSENFDDYQKIFMAIVTSNVKKNVKLFKNRDFLDTAERFAASEAGKLWFHKVILENDHFFVHTLNIKLDDEIQTLMKISPTENREMCVDACRLLSSTVKMKVVLNIITIISAGSNLWLSEKPAEVDVLQKLSKSTEDELEKIQNIVRLLNPTGLEIDPILRE